MVVEYGERRGHFPGTQQVQENVLFLIEPNKTMPSIDIAIGPAKGLSINMEHVLFYGIYH